MLSERNSPCYENINKGNDTKIVKSELVRRGYLRGTRARVISKREHSIPRDTYNNKESNGSMHMGVCV